MKEKKDKGIYAYRVRYLFLFHLLRGNPSIENNITSTKKRSLYRGWLCHPLIVFCVTVFPSFCGTLGQGSELDVSRKNSPLPSHRAASRHSGAVQSHRSRLRLPKARFWRALLILLYHFARTLIIKVQVDFFAILWGRKNTLDKRPNKCKCACGTFALARRCSQLYAQGFRPPSRRLGGLRADFAHS